MSKKEFLKLLSDPEVQQAIRAIITPVVSDATAKDITSQVLKSLRKKFLCQVIDCLLAKTTVEDFNGRYRRSDLSKVMFMSS